MTIIVAFTLAAAATYLLRSSMVLFGGRLLGSDRFASNIALVSPAVIAAIVASALFIDGGRNVTPPAVSTLAVVAGLAAVRRTNNVSAALMVGMPIYWIGALAGLT